MYQFLLLINNKNECIIHMSIKYIPVSLRTLNEGKRGKQRQFYILKRADNFDMSSIGDKIYNDIKADGRRGSDKNVIITKATDIIRNFPLAKRFHISIEEMPAILSAKVNDLIYDAYNDRFLYLLQRYDGGSIERGEKKNLYLSSDSINFPVEARNVKKKYDINYIPKDTNESMDEKILNNSVDLYCDEPITIMSVDYNDDIKQYVLTIEISETGEQKELYLDEEDYLKLKDGENISDAEGHELVVNSIDVLTESYNRLQQDRHYKYKNRHVKEDDWTRKRIALNKLKKEKYKIDTEEGIYRDELEKIDDEDKFESLNEDFADPFIRDLIDSLPGSTWDNKNLFKYKMRRFINTGSQLEFDKITNKNYSIISPKEARKEKDNIKIYYNEVNGKPIINGIISKFGSPVYDIYNPNPRRGSSRLRSELAMSKDSEYALVFDSNISHSAVFKIRNDRENNRKGAIALMDPSEIKKKNILRYKNIISSRKYDNDPMDDYIKKLVVIINKAIENKFKESGENQSTHSYNSIEDLTKKLNAIFRYYSDYVALKNRTKQGKADEYDLRDLKETKDNIKIISDSIYKLIDDE